MNKIRVIMPDHYDLVAGDTFQLFYRGIVEAPNPFCYDIVAVCEKGKNYPRYFEYTPEEEGVYELNVYVCDEDKNILGSGKTTLRVSEAQQPEKSVSVLCIGDSLTADGVWVHELKRRLTETGGEPTGNGFKNVKFIGACEKEGTLFEGYGGWKWESYLSEASGAIWIAADGNDKTDDDQHSLWEDQAGNMWKLETICGRLLKLLPYKQEEDAEKICSRLKHRENAVHMGDIIFTDLEKEKTSPFYSKKTDSIDFKEYCKKNGFDGIDAVYILLGWNGLAENSIPLPEFCKKQAEKAQIMADKIHSAYPDALIRIVGLQVPSVNGGTGASYGARLPYCDDYLLTKYVFELNLAYEEFCMKPEYCNYVEFISLSGQFDTDYNMPSDEKYVNTRNRRTERIGTNGVHPSYEGKMQIADAIYRNVVKSIKI